MKSKLTLGVLLLTLLACSLSSCGHRSASLQGQIDSLNQRAYNFRYINIDSVRALSEEVCQLAGGYDEYAMLNLAYVTYQQMDYWQVDSILSGLYHRSNNQIYLFCADVMRMKMTQRINDGVTFFRAERSAQKRMARILEEQDELNDTERQLFNYGRSEYYIVLSTYYYYQDNYDQATSAIEDAGALNLQRSDVPQWIYYNYMLGSGGLLRDNDPKRLKLTEFDHLVLTYSFARRLGYIYFEANALQSLSMMYDANQELIEQYRYDDYQMLEAQNMSWADDDLALAMCNHAIYLFRTYGDIYQTASAYRSCGELFFDREDYDESIENYAMALHYVNLHHLKYYQTTDTLKLFDPAAPNTCAEAGWLQDPHVLTIPEWIASIRQQLSLAFSAVGNKPASDYNRNAYLDILLSADQNEELEARNQELRREARAIIVRLAVALLAMLLMFVAALLARRRLRQRTSALVQRLKRLQAGEEVHPDIAALDEQCAALQEALQVSRHSLKVNKESNVEDRAKVTLVYSILPYLDRIGAELIRMKRKGNIEPFSRQYIAELIDEIEQHNEVLTEWIKIRQGELSLHITTVSLQRLFSIVRDGHYSFDQKGISLQVSDTQAQVKADEALTLFMINTLADNARKFTPEGGTVKLQTEQTDQYVEVQVMDNGCGLSPEEVDTINNGKLYEADVRITDTKADTHKGFGFGLMNCRSIIEKYKKHSAIFNCCTFGVRSQQGKGSIFFFRLPRIATMLTALLFTLTGMAQTVALYDSVYQCNIEGRYIEALQYGDMALTEIDERIVLFSPVSDDVPQEILSYQQGYTLDYRLILGLRNELALAALALNDWELYHYNNDIYTQLQKYVNQDETLPEYCEQLEQFQHTARLLLAFIIIFAIVALLLIRRAFGSQLVGTQKVTRLIDFYIDEQRNERQQSIASLCDALAKSHYEESQVHVQNQILDNCLSAIKHESMYYPSRIRQLTERMDDGDIDKLDELVSYYHHIYSILCSQANEQLEKPSFKRQTLSVDNVFGIMRNSFQRIAREAPDLQLDTNSAEASVLGDAVLLSALFDNVLKWTARGTNHLTATAQVTEHFVDFSIHNPDVSPTEQELHDTFHPAKEKIPMLIAKQIVREHDIYSGNPGLRLYALRHQSGYAIHFTLLKK